MKGLCPTCERPLFKTPSGAVCWDCNGRVHPHVTEKDIEQAVEWDYVRTLPEAFRLSDRRWTVPGIRGMVMFEIIAFNPEAKGYEAQRKIPIGTHVNTENRVIANLNGKARLLQRCMTPDERKAKKKK